MLLCGNGLRVLSHNVANRDICDILRHSATFCDMLQHSATFERETENPTPRPLPPFAARHGGTIGRPRGSVVGDCGGIGPPNFGGSLSRDRAPIGAPNCSYLPPRSSTATRPFVPCVGTTALPSCRLHRSCFVFSAQSGLRSGPCVASTSAPNSHIPSRL